MGNTAIGSWWLRFGGEDCHRELAGGGGEGGGGKADIKSNNPHLTGGEKKPLQKKLPNTNNSKKTLT